MKKEIGKRITLARNSLKMSQKSLAISCGWTEGLNISARISNYETGTREPAISDIIILANVLRVSPEWLIFGSGEGPRLPDVKKNDLKSKIQQEYKFEAIPIKSNYSAS